MNFMTLRDIFSDQHITNGRCSCKGNRYTFATMLVYFGKQFVSLRSFLLIGCMLPIPFYLLKINLYHNLISCVSTDPLAPILLATRRDNTAPFAAPRPPVYTLRSVSPSPRGAHLTSPPPISVTRLIHHRDPHIALVLPRIPSPGPHRPRCGSASRRVGVAASPHRYRRSNGPGPLPSPPRLRRRIGCPSSRYCRPGYHSHLSPTVVLAAASTAASTAAAAVPAVSVVAVGSRVAVRRFSRVSSILTGQESAH